MLRNAGLTRLTRPTPDFAVAQQGEPTQVLVPTRVVQVGKQVLKPELNTE
jgi:hypothetical protein